MSIRIRRDRPMAILRHAPGERAPIAGTYALVGHYGEVTGFAVECQKGEKLPLVSVTREFGELWFVFVGETVGAIKAA
jgi:hypothetical protein